MARSEALSYYRLNSTSFYASRYDERFSYCCFVPSSYEGSEDTTRYRLLVAMHGSERGAQAYRDAFAEFAEAHDCIVLAPLFPCGIGVPGEEHNYKWIKFEGIRFDHALLDMVAEVAELYEIETSRFLLHGFSGGGHFAHRLFYLHPRRLLGVSIGAPGIVTLLDEGREWWVGVGDIEQQFGTALDYAAMREVPVQMVIGSDDTETWEITVSPGDAFWKQGVNETGVTRLERMESLKASFEAAGIGVRHDIVLGAAHEGFDVLEPVKAFFGDVLDQHR